MDDQQLNDFIENAVENMEGAVEDPYQCVNPGGKAGKSGVSFGLMQNDVGPGANNEAAQDTFADILDNYYAIHPEMEGEIRLIMRTALDGKALSEKQVGIVNAALALPANQTLVDKLDEKQLNTVIGYVQSAFIAAKHNSNGPGELNPNAPNPYFITVLAEWGNMTNGLGQTDAYLSNPQKATTVSLDNYVTNYLYKCPQFTKTTGYYPAFQKAWTARINDATTKAISQSEATFTSSSKLTITPSDVNGAGSNYLAMLSNGVSYLWSFAKPATGAAAGAVKVFEETGTSIAKDTVATIEKGWKKISSIFDPELEVVEETDDTNGNQLKTSTTVYGDSDAIASTDVTTNTYDSSGNKLSTSEAKTDFVGTDPNNPSKAAATDITTSKYNDSGSLSANSEDKIDADGNITITENTKDANGNPKASIVIKMDAKGSTTISSTTYDAKGNPLTNTEKQTDSGTGITDTLDGYASDGTPFSSKAGNGNLIYNGTYTNHYNENIKASYNTSTVLYKDDSYERMAA